MSEHAIRNAKGWLGEIVEMTTALAAAEAGGEIEGDECSACNSTGEIEREESADDIRQRIEEGPLSVQIRNGWYSPGCEEKGEPEEYEILLSTGGPALRIYGDLGAHNQPDDYPRLQWQDWGTPWTDYRETTEEEDAALLAYVRCFYWGE